MAMTFSKTSPLNLHKLLSNGKLLEHKVTQDTRDKEALNPKLHPMLNWTISTPKNIVLSNEN
jgi:hypothetical protein